LSSLLKGADRLGLVALVIFGFASVAVMNAAVMDGLVAPNVMRRILEAGAGAGEPWQAALRYNFEVNQAYARLYAMASSIAVIFWSVSILRSRVLARGLGIYGVLFSAVAVIVVASGRVPMDVHGFGAIVLGQAIWFIIAGTLLWGLNVPNQFQTPR
jgi:hypothetical protein